MTFLHPDVLLALGALPAVAWFLYAGFRRPDRRIALLFGAENGRALVPARGKAGGRVMLWTGAVAALIVALARPQWGFHWEDLPERGLNVIVALDTSNSMRAEDFKPNRFQRAKWAIRDLADRLPGDRLGLIAFSGSAFVQCPLTSDRAAFSMTLDDARPGITPRGGTAFAPALLEAAKCIRTESNSETVIVFISDGEDLEGGWEAPLETLRRQGVRIYAIGIGTEAGSLIPVPEGGEKAGSAWVRNSEGNPVLSRLKEDALERMALSTSGMYIRATTADFGMDRILEKIMERKRTDLGIRRVRVPRDHAAGLIALVLGLLGIEAVRTGWRNGAPSAPAREDKP